MTLLERLITQLDDTWRDEAEFDDHLARLLRVGKLDTLTVPTTRYSLDSFGVLERDGAGRVRKRAGYVVPSRANFEEIENRRLREAQIREEEEHQARERRQEAERNPVWAAQRAVIVGVVDERLRELGLVDADGRVVHVTQPGVGPAEKEQGR